MDVDNDETISEGDPFRVIQSSVLKPKAKDRLNLIIHVKLKQQWTNQNSIETPASRAGKRDWFWFDLHLAGKAVWF